jgi:hypothetical protein
MIGPLFRWLMGLYDLCWRRVHRVEPVDALVSLSYQTYRGPTRVIGSRSVIREGDLVAHLHFNRQCLFGQRSGPTDSRLAFHFARLLFASLGQLAQRVEAGEEPLSRVQALHGVTWFRPHGQRLGFSVERLPDTFLNRMRRLHFRLFLRAFFPDLERQAADLHPHAFWLPRDQLVQRFRPGQALPRAADSANEISS